MDELLPAVCFAARAAVRDPVEDAIYGTEQSTVPDCHHARPWHRLRARDARRAADGAAAVARGDPGGPWRQLRQYRLYGARSGARRARPEGGGADRPDLLLRQHLSVYDRAVVD